MDTSCFREFYTDMTQEQMTGGPDGGPLDCVKFFRLHHVPRGAEIVEISNQTVQLYTVDKDLEERYNQTMRDHTKSEVQHRLYEADRQKNLERKVQDTMEKNVKPGPNKINNYFVELEPFRGTSNKPCGLNKFVALQAAINNKFGEDAEEQRVFVAVTDHLFETTSVFYKSQFFLFFFGFMIPFICQIFYCESAASVYITVTVCMISQILFFLLEVVQMVVKGSRYFEFWNLIDVLLFAVFVIYYLFRMTNTEKLLPRNHGHENEGVPCDDVSEITAYAIAHTIILLFSSLKLLNFLRVFNDFGQFVQLL